MFSVPGPGITDVPVSQSTTAELPRSPAQALKIDAPYVGYNIILYAPGLGDSRKVDSYSIKRNGAAIDVKTVSNFNGKNGIQPRQQCIDMKVMRAHRVSGRSAPPWCPAFDGLPACRGELDKRFPSAS